MNRRDAVTTIVFLALAGAGALAWAKARDPFGRTWFVVRANDGEAARCVAVRPKTIVKPFPTVVFLHDAASNLLNTGTAMRQIAEMGLAVVGIEYNQTNQHASDRQFNALMRFLNRQQWIDTNRVAWVGAGLGAQQTLNFALRHPVARPRLLIGLRPGRLETSNFVEAAQALRGQCAALLIHDANDRVFSEAGALRIAERMRSNGIPTEVKLLSGDLQANADVVYRGIGEHVLEQLKGSAAFSEYRSIASWRKAAKPFWVFGVPAALWVFLRLKVPSFRFANAGATARSTNCGSRKLRWSAGLMAILAFLQTVGHFWAQQCTLNSKALPLSRKLLVQSKLRPDFDALLVEPVFRERRVKDLLDHIELADYNRLIVGWKLDDTTYRAFVLSATITAAPDEEPFARRPLWEHLYPRIRKEANSRSASELVVRELRERVTIREGFGSSQRVDDVWGRQMSDCRGFEVLIIAALRSVGIPARLDDHGRAEILVEGNWRLAPRPMLDDLR